MQMAAEQKLPVRELLRHLGELKRERSTFEPYWRDIKDYIAPHRGRFLFGDSVTEVNDGSRKDGKVINGAATKAVEVAANGMQSGLTSKARRWMRTGSLDSSISRSAENMRYYALVEKVCFEHYDASNLYDALLDVYNEMLYFGTGALAILPHPEKVFFFRSFTCGSYWLSYNIRQELDAFFTFDYLTVKQMVDEYGYDRLSERAKDAYNHNRLEERFKVYCATIRNPERYGLAGRDYMPVVEAHFEEGTPETAKERQLLAVRYFRSFPIAVIRWSTVGNDVYGYSPSRMALGNVKMLQMMERDKLQALRKLVDPPLQGPNEFDRRGINASPGGYNVVTSQGDGIRPLYLVNPDIGTLNAVITQTVVEIQRFYYNDLFLMLQQRDAATGGNVMTAREVEERSWEKLQALGPVLERIHHEGLDIIVSRTTQMLYYAGKLPDPPEEIRQAGSRIEYISILSQAQKAVAVRSNESLLGYVGSVVGIFPEAKRKINISRAIDNYAEAVGADKDIVVDDQEYRRAVEEDAQMMKLAQSAKIGGDMAKGAKVASEVDAGNLSDVVANLTGGSGGQVL